MYRRWLGRWPPRRRVRGLAAIQDTQTRWAEIKPPFDHLAQQHTYRIAPSDATAAISANHAGKRLAHSDGGSLIALRRACGGTPLPARANSGSAAIRPQTMKSSVTRAAGPDRAFRIDCQRNRPGQPARERSQDPLLRECGVGLVELHAQARVGGAVVVATNTSIPVHNIQRSRATRGDCGLDDLKDRPWWREVGR